MSTRDSDNEFEEEIAVRTIVIIRELLNESSSRITWQHSKETYTTSAEITLVNANYEDLMSSDLVELCESFEKL